MFRHTLKIIVLSAWSLWLGWEVYSHWNKFFALPLWKIILILGVMLGASWLLVQIDRLPAPWRKKMACWGMWILTLFFLAATPFAIYGLLALGKIIWTDSRLGAAALALPALMMIFLDVAFLRMAWRQEVRY